MRALSLAIALGLAVAAAGCGGGAATPPETQLPASSETIPVATEPATTQVVEDRSFPEIVAEVRSGVLRIEAATCEGGSQGTGFLVGPRLVATAQHVVADAQEVVVIRGGKTLATAEVIGADAERDVALLQTAAPIDGHVFKIASGPPALGADVAVLGYPLGLPLSVTRGSVSGLGRKIPLDGVERTRLVQTDAAVNPGNSGGPLIDPETEKVVGIVVIGGSGEIENIAFAVSPRVARPLLQAWTAAPQPVAAADCAEPSEETPVQAPAETEEEIQPAYFDGQYFSVAYPDYWFVETNEEDVGGYLDTTIRNPDDSERIYMRVDVTPQVNVSTPEEAAAPVIRHLEGQPGYQEIDYQFVDFHGYPAVWWEYVVQEHGALAHKVDIFFIDDEGAGFGFVTQAPDDVYYDWLPVFDAIRETFVVNY